uniref:Uncharacterized protein n=1 Tax=Nelumbo nucifera TaxID=4432 RepID=A0A822YGX8_NELNU|nr:TPA_asm: hypothetical protein HUJ06_012295 [Nelumbo nucifera]
MPTLDRGNRREDIGLFIQGFSGVGCVQCRLEAFTLISSLMVPSPPKPAPLFYKLL